MQRRRHDGSRPAVHWLAALLLVVLGAAIWIGSRGGGTESSAEPEPARAELDEDRPVEELESVASIGEGRNPAAPDDPSVPRAAAPRGHADEPMVGVGGSIRGTATALTHSYHPELLYQVLAGIQPGETGKQIEARLGEAGPVLRKEARRALSGVEIVLSRSRPSEGVPAEQRALSDEAGAYAFDLLAPGDWEVRIVPGADLPRLRSDHRLLHRKRRLEPGEIRIVDFELPGEGLRREFLAHRMPELDGKLAGCLARRTEGWSFAYLNELRTTAAILAIQRGAEPCQPALAEEAFDLLQAQFRSGTKNHKCARAADVGFRAA